MENNKHWMPVPEIISIPSYVEYMENYEKYRSPLFNCVNMLDNYQCYIALIEHRNKRTQEFWDNEDKYVFNEDKTMYVCGVIGHD